MNPSHAFLKEAHGRRRTPAPFRPSAAATSRDPDAGRVIELEERIAACAGPAFQQEALPPAAGLRRRPTPLFLAERLPPAPAERHLSQTRGSGHTGAHNHNTVGQALLALMGKRKLIAETGAGQHGVATATTAASSGWNAASSWGWRNRPAGA